MTQPNPSLANPATPATETKRSGSPYSGQQRSLGVRDHSNGTGASLAASFTEIGYAYGCVDWFMYVKEAGHAEPTVPPR